MPWPSRDKRRVLIFEPDAEGHSQEWLEHLVAFVAAEKRDTEICLVVARALRGALERALPADAGRCVRLVALSPLETRLCTMRPLAAAAFARWWTMRRYLRRLAAGTGLFLSLDLLSLPLALGLGAQGSRLSGILFRPSVHYGMLGSYRPSFTERWRDCRKDLLYRQMLRNPALNRVLSLDPFFPAHARARYVHGDKVTALPDPAHSTVELLVRTDSDFVPPGRVGFLLFGYLAERKGPLVVLDALRLLPVAVTRRVAVLFAGRIDPELRRRIEGHQRDLAVSRPELWLHIDDRRLDHAELAALVRQSDVVLAPYQRFVGSSGVLLWAARAGRPVLAQDFGLVGRLTRDHRLGIAVDSSDPEQIAREMARMVQSGPETFIDRPAAARFVAAQTPQRFASLVLSV